jgi:hypothetical protein
MKIEKNYLHLPKVFLDLISSNKEFKTRFEVFAPEVYAEIQSFVTNPNCTCRGKIAEYVRSNSDKCTDFVNLFLLESNTDIDLEKITREANEAVGVGRVFRIKKSEWPDFSRNMSQQGVRFRGFSVVPVDEENIDVYLL